MRQFCVNCIYRSLPSHTIDLKSDSLIFLEGSDLTDVFQIESGYVKISRYQESGDETVISILGPDDYIALLAVLQGKDQYIASATTLTEARLRVMSRSEVTKAFSSNEIFQRSCLNCAITRTNFFQQKASQSGNTDIEDKILSMLKYLLKKFGGTFKGKDILVLPFSKTVLANIVGIRRETLSRYLKIMQERNIIIVKKNNYIIL